MTEATDGDAKLCQHEVQRALGRCILKLQLYEKLLKALIADHRIEGPVAALAAARSRRQEKISRHTLGALVREFLGSYLAPKDDGSRKDTEGTVDSPEAFASIQFGLVVSDAELEDLEAGLKGLVSLRNSLVHTFVDDHDIWTVDGCGRAQAALEDAARQIDAHHARLMTFANMHDQVRQQVLDHIRTAEFRESIVGDATTDVRSGQPGTPGSKR